MADADTREVWRALGRDGLLDEANVDSLLYTLDARHPVGTVLSVCVQIATALPILRAAPDTEPVIKARDAAQRGEAMLALAVTDSAASGSDLMSLGTTAALTDDTVRINGGKSWITNACTADYALVLARHRPQHHFTSFLWVLVPTGAPGVHTERAGGRLFDGSGLGHLRFDDVVLDRDHLLGPPGRGLPTFARHVATERIVGWHWARAICRRVLTDTYQRLNARGLWGNDAIRARFARCLVELRRLDGMAADNDPLSSMLLKAATAESLDLVLTECVQLQGADAFRPDGPAALRAETAMFGIAGGASGAMLSGIAEHAAGLLGITP
ncbi:acyl-CoA dehydrogenase family protein [Actinocrispum wychmicini]|uniref:Acyl-CoA dehydrogenase-like protein n=1 Tax=Actinocrispum wychmicini TaxID=1213861 RepID=A0A4R2JPK5_9PSEU|nr:acyl-CoA dehydrogenase family protein [Actinocrispum wychmicini]TCO60702.1 acyl-CoA dehydrogenase-like protein [Actinocrispum wychmicini]